VKAYIKLHGIELLYSVSFFCEANATKLLAGAHAQSPSANKQNAEAQFISRLQVGLFTGLGSGLVVRRNLFPSASAPSWR